MIRFTDPRLYVKGTCAAMLTDKSTGDIKYWSDKFQTGNITTSLTEGEIRAGLGNGIAAIIPSDSDLQVEFTAADFSLWAKVAQVGGTLNYNAPTMTCQVVEATSTSLALDVSKGAPVAQLGFSQVRCYVQEVGKAAPVGVYGTAYPIDADTGEVKDFVAKAGMKYKVWYCVNNAFAQVATISSFFDPAVYHFTAVLAVYANKTTGEKNSGTRVGWLYVIVPSLKLGGNAGVVGDQTNNDTTSVSGRAVTSDADVVSELCEGCNSGGNVYAYYVYVPDDGADAIQGLAVVGGTVSVATSATAQIPVRFVMRNGELVIPASYSEGFTYDASGAPEGTTVSDAGLITAGATAGDFDVAVTYDNGGEDLKLSITASVTASTP